MDKNAIKKYAVWARNELIARVMQKAREYGITEEEMVPANADSVNGKLLTDTEKKQREALIKKIQIENFEQVMEEVAYTWFNRFTALRFMEVNNYLPSHVRVFTDEENKFEPQILTEAIHLELDGLDMDKVFELKNASQDEALYKYLLIVQCNVLNEILPGMFQKIADYTELLLPDYLLREGSVIEQMISLIPEEDWTDQVQIIGWLYQFYNSKKKDEVFAALKKNVKIDKKNIPAATQLFTPDWIVRYMVENSLGRLWIEGHPDDKLKSKWQYYLDEAKQEKEVEEQLAKIREEYAMITPEQIKCIDPCMGSGHILVYMFDVLMQIYEEYGYTTSEAVRSIVENNIYGLDIDERAAQLSYFAVMMKARQYDRRFFNHKDEEGNLYVPQPQVYAIVESNNIDQYTLEYFVNGDNKLKEAIDGIIKEMEDAKEYGSILNITPVDFEALYERIEEVKRDVNLERDAVINDLALLIKVAEVISQKYHTVITNPPYMVMSNGSKKLNLYTKKYYSETNSDLFACFIQKGNQMLIRNGFNCMVTMQSWMFLAGFKKMRDAVLKTRTITTLMDMDSMVMGIAFGTAVTVFRQNYIHNYIGSYHHIKLQDINNEVPVEFPVCSNRFSQISSEGFVQMPNTPIAYWVTDNMMKLFKESCIGTEFVSGGRNKTHNDEKYLRMMWEVPRSDRWALYAKGGAYRKWYGDIEYLVDWSESARREYASHGGLVNERFWEKEGITWTLVTAYKASFRCKPAPVIYSSVSPTIFDSTFELNKYILALLNSKVSEALLNAMNPTLATNVSDILGLPIRYHNEEEVKMIVDQNINYSKTDWDSFETSWDFVKHPFVYQAQGLWDVTAVGASMNYYYGGHPKVSCPLELCFMLWQGECNERFIQLKGNEEELNRIFIEIYGLQEELTSEVADKDVTVRKADLQRDIKSFISYAVGCMFGRYSLYNDGLLYAGGAGGDYGSLVEKIQDSLKEQNMSMFPESEFYPDADNVIPICDDEYFTDDIVNRFVRFVEAVYGEDSLEDNLKFIADALGGKGQSREVIRTYFLKDFYKDHVKMYQKRPIYWLFDSGKKNGFKCLIYMHRYQPDTIARIRTDYVHEQQSRYRTEIADIKKRMENVSISERAKLNKKLNTLQAQEEEIRIYEEKIHHLADQMISIDFDDGVKVNYAKFQDVLAKIK